VTCPQVSGDTWERVADDVRPGWVVTQFDEVAGETQGTVDAVPQLDAGVLRVPVRWELGMREDREMVEAPVAQRAVRYVGDSAVLISGTHGMWLFQSER